LLRRLRAAFGDPYLWLVVAFCLFAVLPLAGPNYFLDAHDAPHTLFFLTELDAALRDGVLYPGWATDQSLGYGYPTFVFYAPLAYFTAEGFYLLGATKLAAIKWTWALSTLGAGLAMYLYARHVMGRRRGFLAAVLYAYAPYHLVNIYVRADLAEYYAFIWMPLALLGFHHLVAGPEGRAPARAVALAGLAYAALLLSHNLMGILFTPVLALYILFLLLYRRGGWRDVARRAGKALAAASLAVGIAAILLLPGFFERQYINQDQWTGAGYGYASHFLQPAYLLTHRWGYAPGPPGTPGGTSYQFGTVPFLLAAVAAVAAAWQAGGPGRERALVFLFAGAGLALTFLMLPLSAPLWELVPLVALVQFPWRLLAPAAVVLSILAGFALPWQEPDAGRPPGAVHGPTLALTLVAVLATFAYTLPQYTSVPGSAESPLLTIEFELEYEDMRGMTRWTEEMPPTSPLVAQYQAGEPLVTGEVLAPGASLEMIRAGGASDEMRVRSPQGTTLLFYTYYFPGWQVYVDGQRLPESALEIVPPYGLLAVEVPPGEHHVLLRWGDTPLRRAGKLLSLAFLVLALGLVLFGRKDNPAATATPGHGGK
jgi:hypothetical protein